MEPEQSDELMKATWNPADGFEIICKNFDDMLIYTTFAESTISASNTLKLLLNVILKTGGFGQRTGVMG